MVNERALNVDLTGTYQNMSTGRKKERKSPWRARARAQSKEGTGPVDGRVLGLWANTRVMYQLRVRNPVRQCVKQVAWEKKKEREQRERVGGKHKA